jgi:hypothetical protein
VYCGCKKKEKEKERKRKKEEKKEKKKKKTKEEKYNKKCVFVLVFFLLCYKKIKKARKKTKKTKMHVCVYFRDPFIMRRQKNKEGFNILIGSRCRSTNLYESCISKFR